ncbi:MAG: ABC transporter permease [Chloroflexota bacterium]|nr:MAG: ABC transporter permease [Chloroflexota bacterium]
MTTSTEVATLSADAITIKEESPFQVVWKRFRRHKLAMVALFIMGALFLISIFVQYITPFKVDEVTVGDYFLPFGSVQESTGRIHFLGTDHIGRDYFTRLLYAGRISLSVALLAVLISETIGMTIGSIAGFYGGIVDALLMRFVEFLLTIPALPLLLIISSMLLRNPDMIPIPDPILNLAGKLMLLRPSDARQAILIVIVLAGLGWLGSAQLMRGMVLSLREQIFVEAARSLGSSDARIIFRHMIPNSMAPIIVSATLNVGGYIIYEAALSFLGFGIQDPIPTWGNMLSATQQFMFDKPWLPLVPGFPIFLTSLSFNYIGDGLRDALDPRLKM